MIIDDLICEDDEEIEIEEKEIKTNIWMKDGAGSYCAGAGNHKLQKTCQYLPWYIQTYSRTELKTQSPSTKKIGQQEMNIHQIFPSILILFLFSREKKS